MDNHTLVKPGPPGFFPGFLVHAYADIRRDRLYFTGRLDDGRSFAAMESRWRPSAHILDRDRARAASLLSSFEYETASPELESFSGNEPLILLRFSRFRDRTAAMTILENERVPSPDGDMKPVEAFLAERYIRGPVTIRGNFRSGRFVDMVFPDPEILPPGVLGVPDSGRLIDGTAGVRVLLKIASVDIETDTRDGSIRAAGIALSDSSFRKIGGLVRVLLPEGCSLPEGALHTPGETGDRAIIFHSRERSLLEAVIGDIRTADPDVLTGWNFLDFDFPRLADRCKRLDIPFALGRSAEEAKYFPGEGRRSAAALVPGRQVIDALRIVRSGPRRFPDYTLETVSRAVLGEGKMDLAFGGSAAGGDRIAALDRRYTGDPAAFGDYCYKDAELVPRIFAKTGLFRLTLERAGLTGVFLDKAWTSVVSFERIYGMELRKRGIAPPPVSPDIRVSGAAGGTVLDPLPGVFNNIAVFDFRSLYPTIIRTFNIDPLALARAGTDKPLSPINAPNGAAFSRTPGVLPALIADYFASRRRALDTGDAEASHVYKILMNSFYGVMGTAACRYGRTELAGAITSFARKWLLLSRDWFSERGCRVLYGDTDSLFVETGLGDDAAYGDFLERCGALAGELNRFLAGRIWSEYRLTSFIELRFEKAYRRFLIPPLRGFHENGESRSVPRGRAKGYGGSLLNADGSLSVEVKGMEAVRSDVTPLAKRVQLELLELVFSGGGEEALRERVLEDLKQLREGRLDGELIYRKRLSRPPETYTASTPPQVKAARALGWKGRRGTVEFVWTTAGPEPASRPHAPFDYDHYTDSQVLPVARSIAAAAGWNADLFPRKGRNRAAWRLTLDGQMELGL
ncbi:MAG: DNA polymerase II [Spirochaetaceae bacterium]|nr:DNA polymerase II [Spirochaetaceae bacterium]